MLPQRDSAVHQTKQGAFYLTEPGVRMYLKTNDHPPIYGFTFYGLTIKAAICLYDWAGILPSLKAGNGLDLENLEKIPRFVELTEYRQDPALHNLFIHNANLAYTAFLDEIERLKAFEVFEGHKKNERAILVAAKTLPLFTEHKLTAKGSEQKWVTFLEVCRRHPDSELKSLGFKTLECLKEVSQIFQEYHTKHYNLIAGK